MVLVNAIEVKYEKDPNNELLEEAIGGFTWDLVEFSENFLKIKLDFENPDAIGSLLFKDHVLVTFWGVEFFKDTKGVEVQLGQEVRY